MAALSVVVLDRDGPDGLLEGLSDNYLRIWFSGGQRLRGKIVKVRAEELTGRGLLGSVCDDSGPEPVSSLTGSHTAFIPEGTIGLASA